MNELVIGTSREKNVTPDFIPKLGFTRARVDGTLNSKLIRGHNVAVDFRLPSLRASCI